MAKASKMSYNSLPAIFASPHSGCDQIRLLMEDTPSFKISYNSSLITNTVNVSYAKFPHLARGTPMDFSRWHGDKKTELYFKGLYASPIGRMIRKAVRLGNVNFLNITPNQAKTVMWYLGENKKLIEKFEVGYFKHVVGGVNRRKSKEILLGRII